MLLIDSGIAMHWLCCSFATQQVHLVCFKLVQLVSQVQHQHLVQMVQQPINLMHFLSQGCRCNLQLVRDT